MPSLEQTHLIGGFYRILDSIGKGGMGIVYKAQDVRTDQTVAIKHLKPTLADYAPNLIERFKREGEALRQLNHPNIVKVYDAFEEDGRYYLVLEYISGGSLADLLTQQGRLPVDQVLKLALEVADALTRTHHLKIIHRDLKPANVLIADDGTPRLTDFGIAHISTAKRVTEQGLVVGTPEYLSPEAFNAVETNVGSDIWAFGVMLFEMLAGQRPFTGKTLPQIMAAVMQKPTPDLEALCPETPIPLIDLIYRMLAKDPQERLNSVRLIGAELEAICQGIPIPAHHVSLPRARDDQITLVEYTPSAPQAVPNNLPAQTTAFVGREEELRELAKLLNTADVRLLTILAPGGMGKTRLSLEAAQGQLEAFPNGVFFVSLAPLNTPDSIVPALAEAIKFTFYGSVDPQQQILDFLRKKEMLLVLDNFEHLLTGASLVAEILQAAPKIKILTTSRSRLNLQEEHLFRIEGMDFPDWETPEDALEYSAVKLFLQSARRVQPNFTLGGDDLTYLARVCRQVEGMPLGILIAAAWVDTLTLREISAEIARSLNFLETEQQNIPARQRSIYAVFDYSWNLLSEEERDVFPKLSVFRGGFTREAAEKVAGATLRVLASLVNKSMLKRNPQTGRYDIHELLRQYAAQKLDAAGLTDSIWNIHSGYFADYMDERWIDLKGRRLVAALREIEIEFDNLRNAWLHLVAHHQTNRLGNFTFAMSELFDLRNRHQEACDLFDLALATVRVPGMNREEHFFVGQLLVLHGWHNDSLGFHDNGETYAQEGITILQPYGCTEALGIAYECLAKCYSFFYQINAENVVQAAERSLQIARELGDDTRQANGLYWLALGRYWQKRSQEAEQLGQEGLRLAHEVGDKQIEALILFNLLTNIAIAEKRYDEAELFLERALVLCEEIGQRWAISTCMAQIGYLAEAKGDYSDALRYFKQSLDIIMREYPITNVIILSVLRIVEVFVESHPDERTVELLSLIVHHPQTRKNVLEWTVKSRIRLEGMFPPDVYAASWERGKTLDLDKVVDELLAEN